MITTTDDSSLLAVPLEIAIDIAFHGDFAVIDTAILKLRKIYRQRYASGIHIKGVTVLVERSAVINLCFENCSSKFTDGVEETRKALKHQKNIDESHK